MRLSAFLHKENRDLILSGHQTKPFQYSDVIYCRKSDLKETMSDGILHTVWEEIMTYRSQYAWFFKVHQARVMMCILPSILLRGLNLQRMFLNRQHYHGKYISSMDYEKRVCTCRLVEQNIEVFRQLDMIYQCLILKCLDESLLDIAMEYWQIEEQEWLNDNLKKLPYELDLTYAYLQFCELLEKHLNTSQAKAVRKSLKMLGYTHPQLSNQQIIFTQEHHQQDCHYTLKDYQNFNGCSYETARSAMGELADLGFYKKCKVGKRFVYRPI